MGFAATAAFARAFPVSETVEIIPPLAGARPANSACRSFASLHEANTAAAASAGFSYMPNTFLHVAANTLAVKAPPDALLGVVPGAGEKPVGGGCGKEEQV